MDEIANESLLAKGLIKEKFDRKKDDLVRELTPKGLVALKEMLKDPVWRRVYLMLKRGVPNQFENLYLQNAEKTSD